MKSNRGILRFFALSMALLLFGTTAGVALDLHYCEGKFQNFSFYSEAKSCHDLAQAEKSCHDLAQAEKSCHSKSTSLEKKCDENDTCCNHESLIVQLDSDFITQGNIDLKEKNYRSVEETTDFHTYRTDIEYNSFYKNYYSPLLERDITIEVQSFLL